MSRIAVSANFNSPSGADGQPCTETVRKHPGSGQEKIHENQSPPGTLVVHLAAASSVAYAASLLVTLHFYRQISSGSIWECILPSPGDAALYTGLVRRVWGRLVSRRGGAVSKSETS